MKSILVVGVRGIPDVEGGVEKYAEQIFPLIASRGWKICIAGMKPYMRAGQYRGVSLWITPSVGLKMVDAWLYSIATLVKAIRMRPDIVHFAELQFALLLCAYKLIGCRVVVRYSADGHADPKTGPRKWVLFCAQYQLRWADNIIAVTPTLAKKLDLPDKSEQIHIIGNAIDKAEALPIYKPAPVAGPFILFVGHITEKKYIHGLIAAFRVLIKRRPQLQLVIVGDWKNSADRKQIEAIGEDRIVILGSLPKSQLAPLYRGARFFVNPSIREGQSNTLLEAIGFDCPVLLSDLPENRDLRLNAKHYFDPENVRSMVSALDRAHANPDVFRVKPDRFPQWEEIAEQTHLIYKRLVAVDAVDLQTIDGAHNHRPQGQKL